MILCQNTRRTPKKAKAREEKRLARKSCGSKAKKDAAAAPAPPQEQPSAPVIPPTKKEMEPAPPIDRRPPVPLTPSTSLGTDVYTEPIPDGRRRPVLSTVLRMDSPLRHGVLRCLNPKRLLGSRACRLRRPSQATPTQATPPAPLPTPTRPPENTPAVSDPPQKTKPDTPINRSPMGSTSSAGMDDLFNMGRTGSSADSKKKTEEPTEPPADDDSSATQLTQ